MESKKVSVVNGYLDNYENSIRNKTIVTAHYPSARPVFVIEDEIFSKDCVWKAESEAWQEFGIHKHSKFEERDLKLLQPEKTIKDKISLSKEIDENSFIDMLDLLKSVSEEAKDRLNRIKYELEIISSKFLFVDVNGSEIFQDLNYWYTIFWLRKKAPAYPSRYFELPYTLGASEGYKGFKKLKYKLREGVLSTAEKVDIFSKVSSQPYDFTFKSGNYKAILDGRVAGVAFHELGAGHLAEAHRILEGEALAFEGKFGKRVSNQNVTLIDDSTFEMNGIKPISYYIYDCEGVRKRKVEIIKKGKFNSLLHSKLTAGSLSKEEGGGILTGNARVQIDSKSKENFPIVPRMSTLYLKPNDMKFEEMVEMAKGGLLISSGAPSGEVITEIAVGLIPVDEVYYVSYSKEIKPVIAPKYNIYIRETTESFLRKIKGIGDKNTLTLDVGFCGAESGFIPHTIFSPAILIDNLSIIISNSASPLKPPLVE